MLKFVGFVGQVRFVRQLFKWGIIIFLVFSCLWGQGETNQEEEFLSLDSDTNFQAFFERNFEDTEETSLDTHVLDPVFDKFKEAEEPILNLEVAVRNYFFLHQENSDSLLRPNLFNFDRVKNYLVLKQNLEYLTGNKWVALTLQNSTYQVITQNDHSAIDTHVENYLQQVFLSFYWVKSSWLINLHLGKIDLSKGSGYLINPTDFTKKVDDLQQRSGFYQIKLDVLFEWFDWRFAYIPDFKTVYREFQIEEINRGSSIGIFYTSMDASYDTLQGSLIFLWNGFPAGGFDLNYGLGDEVILYWEQSIYKKNIGRLRQVGENNLPVGSGGSLVEVAQYGYEKKNEWSIDGLWGISYTPRSWFTLLFEIYYSIYDISWDGEKDKLKRMEQNRQLLQEAISFVPSNLTDTVRNLSFQNLGSLGDFLKSYDPLAYQPLYFMLRIFRDDFLERWISQDFNIASSLVYSVFDTSFVWQNRWSWVSESIVSIDSQIDWYFGYSEGVWVSLPNSFTWQVAMSLVF